MKSYVCILFIVGCFLIGVTGVNNAGSMERPIIFVSILPQKFFVEQLCGDSVDIEVMVAPGANPHSYEPKSSQMRRLSVSEAYLSIGVSFESVWLQRIAGMNPQMRIVHTDEGIEKIAMSRHHHEEEPLSLANKQDQSHEEENGLDPHVWLSPTLVKGQLQITAKVLSEIMPEQAAKIEQNLQIFLEKLDVLDGELRRVLQDKKGMKFMVFHPSWGYFARDYGLEQIAVEVEGKAPKSGQLQELITEARKNDIKILFAQPQFSRKSAQVIAREIHGEVILLDPLAENWLENMKEVAVKINNAVN